MWLISNQGNLIFERLNITLYRTIKQIDVSAMYRPSSAETDDCMRLSLNQLTKTYICMQPKHPVLILCRTTDMCALVILLLILEPLTVVLYYISQVSTRMWGEPCSQLSVPNEVERHQVCNAATHPLSYQVLQSTHTYMCTYTYSCHILIVRCSDNHV